MSKFEMLQTFTCVPKFEGLQTENFSNLRTSTVCRTHIGQKNMKGFPDQTRLVGRHTRELNLVYFFVRNMVGVLFLHHVPSTKNNNIYNGNGVGLIQLVNRTYNEGQFFTLAIVFRICICLFQPNCFFSKLRTIL